MTDDYYYDDDDDHMGWNAILESQKIFTKKMTLIDDGGVGDDENKKKCLYPSTTIE